MMMDVDKIIHENLKNKFNDLLNCEPVLRGIIYDVLSNGCAYIIGGFVRDVFNDRDSRDVDIMVDVSPETLKNILKSNEYTGSINKMGGVKLKLNNLDVDIWSVANNWAFAKKLVKLNDNDKLHSIAKGCFYNYDALVVSVPKFMYNIRYYNDFIENRELDIIQRRPMYKKHNPTVEANIIRAIYIQKQQNINFSNNLIGYLKSELLELQYNWGNVIDRLMAIKALYPKYDMVSEEDIKSTVTKLFINALPSLFDEENKMVYYKTKI